MANLQNKIKSAELLDIKPTDPDVLPLLTTESYKQV